MSKRILVIDSSPVIRTLLQVHLQQAGHEVQVCPSSGEGARLLRSGGEPPELLFLAVNPAVKEDVELLRYGWKPAWKHRVVMALPEDRARIQRHLKATPLTFLFKPFQVQEALALVSALLPGDPKPGGREPGEASNLGAGAIEREGSQ